LEGSKVGRQLQAGSSSARARKGKEEGKTHPHSLDVTLVCRRLDDAVDSRLEPSIRRERKDIGGVDDDRIGDVGNVFPFSGVGTDLEAARRTVQVNIGARQSLADQHGNWRRGDRKKGAGKRKNGWETSRRRVRTLGQPAQKGE
jgi:hypothetical protein